MRDYDSTGLPYPTIDGDSASQTLGLVSGPSFTDGVAEMRTRTPWVVLSENFNITCKDEPEMSAVAHFWQNSVGSWVKLGKGGGVGAPCDVKMYVKVVSQNITCRYETNGSWKVSFQVMHRRRII